MLLHTHPITAAHGSIRAELTSLHFGRPGAGKAYIQAAIHADEVPAMLVAQALRQQLEQLERAGRLLGEVVLVPAANPLGLAQVISERPYGRFDLPTGVNFNRDFACLTAAVATKVDGQLGGDADANTALIRAQLREQVAALPALSDTATLKKALLSLAIDADVVLDLHCDNEAALHVYTGTPLCNDVARLAQLLGARALLHTEVSGGDPFDEACSRPWWELQRRFQGVYPVPLACVAATVELRGEADVDYAVAERDAQAILRYLALHGLIALDETAPAAEPVPEPCVATPLEGTLRLVAPHAGMVVYRKPLGAQLRAGDAVADLIDPVTGQTTTLLAQADGVFFARLSHRYVIRGMSIGKLAGSVPSRSGKLLSL